MQNLPVRGCHALRHYFPEVFRFILHSYLAVLQPHKCRNIYGLGCSPFARHYSGNRIRFLFLRLLRCFTSAGLALLGLYIHPKVLLFYCSGFPHSEISGSKIACISPKLIAACHVLLRHVSPRHPPNALDCSL